MRRKGLRATPPARVIADAVRAIDAGRRGERFPLVGRTEHHRRRVIETARMLGRDR